MLKNLFKKTFDIRDGEIRISFFMQLYIFLLITVLLMVKPTINALFLSKLGANHLPYAYLLVALIAVITSYFYNRAVKKYSLKRITTSTLLFFNASFMLLSFLMYSGISNDFILYAYYLSVSLFAVLVTSQFWILANMVFNAREAKRLFGFIGAGAIAGGIFGGYITSIIAPLFGNRVVILIAALLILGCIPILNGVWKMRIRKLSTYIINQRKTKETEFTPAYKLIIRSKHLTYLAAIVGVGVVMAKLVDFQFSDFANRAIPDSDELASFFGFWFSSFNVIALLIQLFLTNRLLAWLGVTSNLLILPLGIAMGCLLFLTFPELWVLIIIKGMDGSFKQSINKAGIELSILPIPSHVKNQAKSYIDVVVDSIATGFAGLLLIFVIKRLELSTSYITVIILLVLFVWMVLVYKLREAYFESFRTNIHRSLENNELPQHKFQKSNISENIKILKSGNESQILALLERLHDVKYNVFESHIVNLLDHPSHKVKIEAIERLYDYRKGTAIEKVKRLTEEEDDALVYKAIEYLIVHTNIDDAKLFETYLENPSTYKANAALLCLAKAASQNEKLATKFRLNERIDQKIRTFSAAGDGIRKEEVAELMMTIAYARELKFYSFISVNFNNKSSYIVKHAIKAAGITNHPPFIEPLIAFLAIKKYNVRAKKALRNYGESIAKTILEMDTNQYLKDNVRRHIPGVIELFKNRNAIKILMRLLRSKDFVIRLEAAKSLNTIRSQFPQASLDQRLLTKIILRESTYYKNSINTLSSLKSSLAKSMNSETEMTNDLQVDLQIARESLIDILELQLEQSLECVFKLLSLKYDYSDIQTAYFGLKSEEKETKINAIEFLDNLLKSRLKSTMLPMIEYHIIDSDTYNPSSFEVNALTETRALSLLLKNRGSKMKLAVLNVMMHTSEMRYIKLIMPLLKHRNKKVRLFAKHALDDIRSNKKATTLR